MPQKKCNFHHVVVLMAVSGYSMASDDEWLIKGWLMWWLLRLVVNDYQ